MKLLKAAAIAAFAIGCASALPAQAQAPADAKCEFKKLGDMTVDMSHGTPRVTVVVNGQKRWLELRTTVAFSAVRSAEAAAFAGELQARQGTFANIDKKHLVHTMKQYRLKDVLLGDAVRLDAWDVVARDDLFDDVDADVGGFVGLDLLAGPDVELDLGHNRIAFFTETNCDKDSLAYWDGAIDQTDLADASIGSAFKHVLRPVVSLNDHVIGSEVNTVSPASIVNTPFARRMGLRAGAPGVELVSGYPKSTMNARFESFSLGGEKIGHPMLSVQEIYGDFTTQTAQGVSGSSKLTTYPTMQLGLDFLKAHRVLFANGQHKMYFSYNGGPVFSTLKSK